MERNTIQDNKLYMGEREFTYLIKALIRAYSYRNQNQNPEAIVIPQVFEVDGVKVEFPTKEDGESFKEYLEEKKLLGYAEGGADIEGAGREPGESGNPDG